MGRSLRGAVSARAIMAAKLTCLHLKNKQLICDTWKAVDQFSKAEVWHAFFKNSPVFLKDWTPDGCPAETVAYVERHLKAQGWACP